MDMISANYASSSRGVTKRLFGKVTEGDVHEYHLENANGMRVGIINYGAILTSIVVPDRNGEFADITLGYDRIEQYQSDTFCFGAIVGPYANRIGGARFTLDGNTYTLEANDNGNCLHSGYAGLNRQFWDTEVTEGESYRGLRLKTVSPHLKGGFPGNVQIEVEYKLNDQNEIVIDYLATTDALTHLNLTQHSYFNLKGHGEGTILDHELTIPSTKITEPGPGLIPTGRLVSILGTPLDFTAPHTIGERIADDGPWFSISRGYDHNYVVEGQAGEFQSVAHVYEPGSGRKLEVLTTEPGIQFYSGNWLNGKTPGKNNVKYQRRSGFCLEAQHFPDTPNHPEFPTTLLGPDEEFRSQTVYRFSV